MSKYHFCWVGFASSLYVAVSAIAPTLVKAEVPPTRASVESLQNHVDILPSTGAAHPAGLADWLSSGDTINTTNNARVDLRFNDGSLARIGEEATFHFTQDSRTFQLSRGTALFMIPPEQGISTVETPNAVARFQETALVVRYISAEDDNPTTHRLQAIQAENDELGRTVVMVLTDHPETPVEVSLPDGRKTNLSMGQMAIVDGSEIFIFEFDLALFYETSTIVEGLDLEENCYAGEGESTNVVRQDTLDTVACQRSFEGEYVIDPDFLDAETTSGEEANNWLLPLEDEEDEAALSESDLEATTTSITVPVEGKVSPEANIEDPTDLAPNNIAEDATVASPDNFPPLVIDNPEAPNELGAPTLPGDVSNPPVDGPNPVLEPIPVDGPNPGVVAPLPADGPNPIGETPEVEGPPIDNPTNDPTIQGPFSTDETPSPLVPTLELDSEPTFTEP